VERTRTMLLLGAAFVIVGVGLGVFGVVRLTADDPEIDRLNDEIAAIQADIEVVGAEKADVEAQLVAASEEIRAAQDSSRAMVTGARNLDEALLEWLEAFENFFEAEVGFLDTWFLVVERVHDHASIDRWLSDVDAEVRPALEGARDARDTLLEAFTHAEVALAELEQTLAEDEGDR
jgi:hypothetical protein